MFALFDKTTPATELKCPRRGHGRELLHRRAEGDPRAGVGGWPRFELIANIKACDTAKCEVYVCPSVLHTAYCCGKFTNGALVTPQYMNFKGCGAFTG